MILKGRIAGFATSKGYFLFDKHDLIRKDLHILKHDRFLKVGHTLTDTRTISGDIHTS